MSPVCLNFCQLLFGALAMGATMVFNGKVSGFPCELRALGSDWIWFLAVLLLSALAGFLIITAIGSKNAPVCALIEISYPLFTVLFCWLFFGESHLNWQTCVGAVMIFGGIIVVGLGNA